MLKKEINDIERKLIQIRHDSDMTLHQVLKAFSEIGEIKNALSIIHKNQEKGLTEDKALVIIHDRGKTRVYEHGKDITAGISEITLRIDALPVIEYEKVVK